jgi:hypothetical protein
MERSNKIAQAYGYAVCFIAVVTLLFSAKSIIDASFDLSAPLRADRYMAGLNLTSFEAYKRDRVDRRGRPTAVGPEAPVPQPTEADLRKMYESERADQIDNVKFRAMRSLVSNILLVVIAGILFLTHWRWLRRETGSE